MNKKSQKMRLTLVSLSVLLVFSVLFSACATPTATPVAEEPASPTQVEPTAPPEEPEEIIITVLDIYDAESFVDHFNELAAEFEQEHPGVKILLTTADTLSMDAKRLSLFAANEEPDIFWSHGGEELNQFVRQGRIAAIEDLVDQSLWLPGLLGNFESDGHLYGVPKAMNVVGLWYNVGVLESLGLQPPTTFEELVDLSTQLQAEGIIPFGLGNKERWPIGILYDQLAHNYCGCFANERATFDFDPLTWADPCFVKAAEKVVELIDAGFFPTGFNGFSQNEANDLFFNGDAAFIFNGTWMIGISRAVAPSDFQMAFVLWPNPSDAPFPTNDGRSIEGSMEGWAITERCANKELAAEFLELWAKDNPNYVPMSGSLPIIPGFEPDDPDIKAVAAMAAKSNCTFQAGDRTTPAIIAQAWLDNLQSLAGGTITPEEFAQAMADAVESEKANFP